MRGSSGVDRDGVRRADPVPTAPAARMFPLVLDTSAGGDLGLGTRTLPDGRVQKLGTHTQAYRALCLEALDLVRPSAVGSISGETPGTFVRTTACDGLAYGRVSPDYVIETGASPARLSHLRPRPARLARTPESFAWGLDSEEFYDLDVTPRDVTITLRSCQRPMFVHVARQDVDDAAVMDPDAGPAYADYGLDPLDRVVDTVEIDGTTVEDCPSTRTFGLDGSTVSGATIAVESTAYRDTRMGGTLPTADVLLGFDPRGFDDEDVGRLFAWVMERWGVGF